MLPEGIHRIVYFYTSNYGFLKYFGSRTGSAKVDNLNTFGRIFLHSFKVGLWHKHSTKKPQFIVCHNFKQTCDLSVTNVETLKTFILLYLIFEIKNGFLFPSY
jgi:hypothetical protein